MRSMFTTKQVDTTLSNAICGFTPKGECTLLDSLRKDAGGLFDTDTGQKLSAHEYRASKSVMGMHIASSNDQCLDKATFFYDKIHRYLPTPAFVSFTSEHLTHTAPFTAVELFCTKSEAVAAKIVCEVRSSVNGKRNKLKLRSVPQFRIEPDSPQSLNWYIGLSLRIENFLSLFLGTSVGLKRVRVSSGDKAAWLVQKILSKHEKTDIEAWVKCSSFELNDALKKWLELASETRVVEQTVLELLRKGALTDKIEFLSLAQALEAFGRTRFTECLIPKAEFRRNLTLIRKGIFTICGGTPVAQRCVDSLSHANEASYADKLARAYSMFSPELALALVGEKATFIRTVTQTRNFFTHLGGSKQSSVVDGAKELFLLNRRLQAFIRGLMLLEIGINEAFIREPLVYQATKWS